MSAIIVDENQIFRYWLRKSALKYQTYQITLWTLMPNKSFPITISFSAPDRWYKTLPVFSITWVPMLIDFCVKTIQHNEISWNVVTNNSYECVKANSPVPPRAFFTASKRFCCPISSSRVLLNISSWPKEPPQLAFHTVGCVPPLVSYSVLSPRGSTKEQLQQSQVSEIRSTSYKLIINRFDHNMSWLDSRFQTEWPIKII